MAGLAADFARRSDIELDAWEWELIELPEGPCYRLSNEIGEDEFRRWYDSKIAPGEGAP